MHFGKKYLDTNRLYKRLKNGKQVQLFYKQSEHITYTIWLTFKDGVFKLHSFYFKGNDVFQDNNCQDEHIENYEDFQSLVIRLVERFPGVTYY